ncbi:uncharacterized protein LOC121264519 [Juglans microcarpa x Juglans regia]|uniref:uncharacterized protein LOC121264519 n=1 Tax=Juglans microcarpa x Juglans regia TaxID=2249226 RepID=UPI001B7DF5AF|nr:uncharacterized protein LOC121264519 [Juglans microcarpa x Juglans regia]
MALPTSDAVLPISKHCSQQTRGIYNGVGVEVDVHVHVTAEREEFYKEVRVEYSDFHPDLPYEFEFLPVEKPKLLVEKESMQKEKQILVDPISLKGSSFKKASFNMMSLPPPLPPAKSKFLSFSLPNSANSSPRFSSILKKKLRNETKENPRRVSNLARQHSAADNHLMLQREVNLRRSKSADGRTHTPSDDLDFWLIKPDVSEYDNRYYASISKTTESSKDINKKVRCMDAGDKEFKCGAMCLFLPGFSKVKPVRARKVETENENVISRTVSLEKFECGSWASSAVTHDPDDDSKNLYFDLPLELIRANVNDAHSPVTAAFIFDKDQKGILKNSSTRAAAKKSDESPRHVRFSTSSPKSHPTSPASCITPRLRKAREEFNAFLEAQGA